MRSLASSSSLARVSAAALLFAWSGCDAPAAPAVPPDPPLVAPPEIPWLEAGSPPIAAPEIPWLEGSPITRACPTGWSLEGDRCAPWPDAIAACTGAMIRVPGEAACRPLSPSCPVGDFASDLPAGAVHVRASAPAGGDGTLALPFATLAEALASAPAGATIALSRGNHEIAGSVALDVTLRGACASETILLATGGTARLAITSSLGIEDLTFRPGDVNDPIEVTGDHDVSLRRFMLDGGQGYGIIARSGARVVLSDVRVASVGLRVDPTMTPYSAGLAVESGAVLDGTRVVVDEATYIGASAEGARLSLTDSVLRGTREEFLPDAAGATCWAAGTIALTRTVLESNVSRGVEVLGGCSGTTLEDVVVRRMSAGMSGQSFAVLATGPLFAHGLGLFDNAGAALVSTFAGGRAEVSDVVVDGVTGEGTGIGATVGATLTVERAIVRGLSAALYVASVGTIDGEDLHLERVDGSAALALGGTMVLRRTVVNDVDTGLFSGGTGSSIVVTDAVIERVGAVGQPDSDAITARAEGRVEVSRVIVRDAAGTGVAAVQTGAIAIVSDIVCTRCGSAFVALTATVEITRSDVDAPLETGATLIGAGSRISLTDVRIHDVVAGPGTGQGIYVADAAEVTLRRTLVERAVSGLVGEVTSSAQAAALVHCADAVLRDLTGPGIDLGAATADVSRVRIERAGEAGLIARGPNVDATVTDVSMRELLGRPDGRLGRGMHVTSGAFVHGARVTIDGALGVGLLASDPGTRVTLEALSIAHTREEACGAACPDRAAGHGVASLFEAEVSLTRFRVSVSSWAGVLVSDAGVLALLDGFIDGNRVGRAVLDPAPAGLSAVQVTYVGNEALEARDGVTVPPASLF